MHNKFNSHSIDEWKYYTYMWYRVSWMLKSNTLTFLNNFHFKSGFSILNLWGTEERPGYFRRILQFF